MRSNDPKIRLLSLHNIEEIEKNQQVNSAETPCMQNTYVLEIYRWIKATFYGTILIGLKMGSLKFQVMLLPNCSTIVIKSVLCHRKNESCTVSEH